MTLDIYSHVLPSMQEDAALKMDELLNPIEVTDKLKVIKEQLAIYQSSGVHGYFNSYFRLL